MKLKKGMLPVQFSHLSILLPFIGVILLMGLIGLGVHVGLVRKIADLEGVNRTLAEQVDGLQAAIAQMKDLQQEKQGLLIRKTLIQKLHRQRNAVVQWMDALVRITEGLYLTRIALVEDHLWIDGKAESHQAISTFMRQSEALGLFTSPQLTLMQPEKGQHSAH